MSAKWKPDHQRMKTNWHHYEVAVLNLKKKANNIFSNSISS